MNILKNRFYTVGKYIWRSTTDADKAKIRTDTDADYANYADYANHDRSKHI